MDYTIADTVTITCTIGDLWLMGIHQYAIWAIPTPQGEAAQCYLGSQKRFRDDFVLADLGDVLDAMGWTDLGDEDGDVDEITITVPRTRRARSVEQAAEESKS